MVRTEQGNDAIAAQGDVLAIIELVLECRRELPEGEDWHKRCNHQT